MQIAIIGSGNVGKALAGSFVRAGHEVSLSASDPENARAAAQETGARAADSNTAAVEGADAVVLAVPHQAVMTCSMSSRAPSQAGCSSTPRTA